MEMPSSLAFEQISGIPHATFQELLETLTKHLKDEPDDSFGLVGPSNIDNGQKARFFSWVVDYFNNGVGQKYWGPGSQGKWKLEEDKGCIMSYFRSLIIYKAQKERAARLKERRTLAAKHTDEVFEECKKGNFDAKSGEQGNGKGRSPEENRRNSNDGGSEELYKNSSEVAPSTPREPLFGNSYATETIILTNSESANHITGSNTPIKVGLPVTSHGRSPETPHPGPVLTKSHGLRTRAGTLAGAAISVPSVTLSSFRKHVSEGIASPPQKRPRQSENTLQNVMVTHSAAKNDVYAMPSAQDQEPNRVFETRLGDSKTIAFLFAPSTIGFQQFYIRFCEVWRKDPREMELGDVDVKVYINGVAEFKLSFGEDREKSWIHIMKLVEGRPEPNVLVAVGIFSCN